MPTPKYKLNKNSAKTKSLPASNNSFVGLGIKFNSWLNDKRAFTVASVLLLISILIGSSWSSSALASNGDALIGPYMFWGHFWRNKVMIPAPHTDILKFPLFVFQAHTGFHFLNYSIVNYLLVAVTLFAVSLIVYFFVSKKAGVITALSLAFIYAASPDLGLQIAYNTVRNIEYPIILLFFVAVLAYVRNGVSRWQKILGFILLWLIYSTILAGDQLFIYITVPAALGTLAIIWLRENKLRRRAVYSASIVIAAVLASVLIYKFADKIGFFDPDKNYVVTHILLNPAGVVLSIGSTIYQTIRLIGGFSGFLYMTVLASVIFITGVLGLAWALKDEVFKKPYKLDLSRSLTSAGGLLFLCSFGIFVLSGYAVVKLPNHFIATYAYERYVTFLPLLLAIGVGYLVSRLSSVFYERLNLSLLAVVVITLIVMIPVSVNQLDSANIDHSEYQALAKNLQANDVHLIVSGYWHGAATKFWSKDGSLIFAPANTCNWSYTLNSRKDWFYPTANITKSAYVIAYSGQDKVFFDGCTEAKLHQIFGNPAKVIYSPVSGSGKPLRVEIYNYDIRTKMIRPWDP